MFGVLLGNPLLDDPIIRLGFVIIPPVMASIGMISLFINLTEEDEDNPNISRPEPWE